MEEVFDGTKNNNYRHYNDNEHSNCDDGSLWHNNNNDNTRVHRVCRHFTYSNNKNKNKIPQYQSSSNGELSFTESVISNWITIAITIAIIILFFSCKNTKAT